MILHSVITALVFFLMPAPTTLYGPDMTAIVTLPAGYFVVQNQTDAPNGYISVSYDDLTGYVKSTDVTPVDYTPVTKYEQTVTFTCNNDGQPVNLRKSPDRNAEIISVLPASANGRCYGKISGDALITQAGDVWYYVKTNGTYGYCYSAHVSVTPTPPNVIEKEDPPDTDTPVNVDPIEEDPPQPLPQWTAVVFIVVLCIPVPFIMFYLFKKPKNE